VLTSKHHEALLCGPARKPPPPGAALGTPPRSPQRDLAATWEMRCGGRGCAWVTTTLFMSGITFVAQRQAALYHDHMFPQFKDMVTRLKPSIIFSDGEWDLPSSDWHSPNCWPGCSMSLQSRRGGHQRPVGQRHPPQARRLLTTEYTAGMSGIDHPWKRTAAWVIAMATTARASGRLPFCPRTGHHAGGHREPRRQPAARYWAAADGTIPSSCRTGCIRSASGSR